METIPVRHIRATQSEPNFSESFAIRDVRALLDGKAMVQKLHRHDFFFILALKKGKGSHEIDFVPYKVCERSISILRPGQVHQLTLKTRSAGYLMEFKNDFYNPHDKVANQLFRKASNRNFCQVKADGFTKLLSLLTYIFQEYCDKNEGYQEVIKANLGIFFIELIRHRQNSKGPSNNASNYTQERLEEFLALLETHFAKHKQASQYANMLNLSSYQLNAITKETLGKTSSDIINEYIILESKRQLLATSNQVNQIAYHLGYEDVSYFIRFFKKHSGHTPDVFRHNFR